VADSTGPDSTSDVMVPRDDPFEHFAAWWAEAVTGDPLPEAVHLSTANADGRPSGRVILVRSWSARGFDLYTDLRSHKGEDFRARAEVALTWYWKPLGRQVRVTGVLEFLGNAENDLYWRQRPRASQVSAWASEQSQEIASRAALDARHVEVEQRF